jgi:16S rRNA (adenine1518-N6/adenine1519-N6)-dimethyltransferase
LTDGAVVSKIIAACELAPDSVVIEVGPGNGALTERLAAQAGRTIAVEVDPRLVSRLRARFARDDQLTIVENDVLETEPDVLLDAAAVPGWAEYGVAGNLPYNIGAAVLRHFLEANRPPAWMVVMLQREVAASIAAQPGSLSLLGVSVQVYARVRRLFNVPPGAFSPPPKVVSSVLRLDLLAKPRVPLAERDWFFTVVRGGFSAPRKQVHNALELGLERDPDEIEAALAAAGIDATLRPEALSIDDWLRLARALRGRGSS